MGNQNKRLFCKYEDYVHVLDGICKQIVESHADILIAALLEAEDVADFYVRPNTPIPDEFRAGNMIIQTQIVVSAVMKNQDYLGKLSFIHVHLEMADVLEFPLSPGRVLVAVIKPQTINNDVMTTVLDRMKNLISGLS